MEHWIADGIFVVVALLIISGFAKRGFLASILKFARLIIAVVLSYFFGTKAGAIIGEKFLNVRIYDWVYGKVTGLLENNTDIQSVINGIPEFLLNDELKGQLQALQGSPDELAGKATDLIAPPASTFICNVLGYILVFVAALLLLAIVSAILRAIIKSVKPFRVIDSLLGAVLGVAVSAVLLFIAGSVIQSFFGSEAFYTESIVVKFFGESSVLDVFRFLDVGKTWIESLKQ